jgi:hypothetical protein
MARGTETPREDSSAVEFARMLVDAMTDHPLDERVARFAFTDAGADFWLRDGRKFHVEIT